MSRVSYEQTFGLADLSVYSRMIADDNRAQMGRSSAI